MMTKAYGDFLGAKASVTWCRQDPYYRDAPWRACKTQAGGGVLINQAIHTIELMEYIGGKVQAIRGKIMTSVHEKIEVEDTAMLTMIYENGQLANVYATNNNAMDVHVEMSFYFSHGTLKLYKSELILTQGSTETILASDTLRNGEFIIHLWGRKCSKP